MSLVLRSKGVLECRDHLFMRADGKSILMFAFCTDTPPLFDIQRSALRMMSILTRDGLRVYFVEEEICIYLLDRVCERS